MFKSCHFYIVVVFSSLCFSCVKKIPKELIVSKTTYIYLGDKLDSSNVLLEHYFFDEDSIVTKYINYSDGYFYLTDCNKKKNILNKRFYSLDSAFMYGSVTHLDKKNLETKVEFNDSLNNITFSIEKRYRKGTDKVEKQINSFSDGSIQQLLYEYDKKGTPIKLLSVNGSDTLIKEKHIIMYDEKDRILSGTVYYPESRKIIEKGYKNNRLFYISDKQEKKSDSDTSFSAMGNIYWKKYHAYHRNGNLIELRNIQMFLNSNSFRRHSTIEYKYDKKNKLIEETYFDIHKRKVYTIYKDYKY